eukprot:Sspe_Gene.61401::Locus_34073_Transcript_1_2_Confidence_0.500_Length_2681::g.61401::m.61401
MLQVEGVSAWLLLVGLLTWNVLVAAGGRNVSFDERSAIIDGERIFILSGAVHYTRVLPDDWPRVFRLAKELGLNTIQTYFMWNFHEAKQGEWNWSGQANVTRFIEAAADEGLYVTLRIGPYVCGEYYYGGIPLWMRHSGAKCYRCADTVWKKEMARVVGEVVHRVTPLLYPNGGPIIMLQVENEYNGDQEYLNWAVDMARETTTAVPWNLCHDLTKCTAVNHASGRYQSKALCTINGFWMDETTKDFSQPSPKWLADLRKGNPGQVAIWTEDQGWFDQWGVARRVRESRDQLYGIARFFAYGGGWHNFYMLTGGSNFARSAGGVVATAYAPDTVVNWLLLRHPGRWACFKGFFTALRDVAPVLLASPAIPHPVVHINNTNPNNTASVLPCTDTDPSHPGKLDAAQQWHASKGHLEGKGGCLDARFPDLTLRPCDGTPQQEFKKAGGAYRNPATNTCLDSSGALLPCTSGLSQQWYEVDVLGVRSNATGGCLTAILGTGGVVESHTYGTVAFLSNTDTIPHTVPFADRSFRVAPQTVVLVNLNTSEVLFNTSDGECATDPGPMSPFQIQRLRKGWKAYQEPVGVPTVLHSGGALADQLDITDNDSDYAWYIHEVPLNTTADDVVVETVGGSIAYPYLNSSHVAIFSCAMGMPNTGVGPSQGKGLKKVTVKGAALESGWTQGYLTPGESQHVYSNPDAVKWTDIPTKATPLTWYQTTFDVPSPSTSQPGPAAYALNLTTMWKGVAYVNGFNLGRYWLLPGQCSGECAPPIKSGHCYMHWKDCGRATQTLYHIPSSLLKSEGNLVTLFEETVPPEGVVDPTGVTLEVFYDEP